MLTPSYSELMDVIKQSGDIDPRVASRYTVVLAAAKRARQLTDGAEPLTYAPTDRAVSIAVKEMSEGKLRVNVQEELIDSKYDRIMKDQYKYRAIATLSRDDLREDLKDDYSSARTYKIEDEDDKGNIYQDDAFGVEEQDLPNSKEDFDLFGGDEDDMPSEDGLDLEQDMDIEDEDFDE